MVKINQNMIFQNKMFEIDDDLKNRIQNMWLDKCFEEDLVNYKNESVHVMRNTNESKISLYIQKKLKDDDIKISINTIKTLKPG